MIGAAGSFHGPLVSRVFLLERCGPPRIARLDPSTVRQLRALAGQAATFGPASPVRALADRVAIPLVRLLGFTVRELRISSAGTLAATLVSHDRPLAVLAVRPAGEATDAARLEIVRETLARGLRWALLCNARHLQLIDCSRPHARRWLAVRLDGPLPPEIAAVLLDLFSADALRADGRGRSPLEEAIATSDDRMGKVRHALQQGVERAALELTRALAGRQGGRLRDVAALFEEALTVVYRILFLMFAESRGLVPIWHPTYREAYTIEALRDAISRREPTRGTWEALQAISRLAHRGAMAGTLRVTPFNGRLFSPRHAPAVSRSSVAERDAAAVVAALTLDENSPTIRNVPFIDLGVEQLGAVYERVLDFAPVALPRPPTIVLRRSDARKSTGSFYTPRSVTEFVVRRALHPLVAHASPEEILALRVLDPAMGSGAFLVAACRYLAAAYETALVRSGAAGGPDFSAADRAGFRRVVAQRCLFGVDLNPMAVQLGRLSLWLAALAADRPLTFLDHRLRIGNSLAGASPDDVARQTPGRSRPLREPTLFGRSAFDAIGHAVSLRQPMALRPDDTAADVRAKEDLLGSLESPHGPLAVWRRLLDLWCAVWFWPERDRPPDAREYGALAAAIRGDSSFAPASSDERLAIAAGVARDARFFHWTLEFPEVFFEADGAPRSTPGFDAVVGNPPWEMLRADGLEDGHDRSRQLVRFSRESGVYRSQSSGHANAYQLFVERSHQLVRAGGRIGLVLPWGWAADVGSTALRQRLLDTCDIDEIVGFDNRDAIFPIHRGLRFMVLHATAGGTTTAVRCRLALRDVQVLDRLADTPDPDSRSVVVPRELLVRTSGRQLSIPWIRDGIDVRLIEQLTAAGPALGDAAGWDARFGRELNATEDRRLFTASHEGTPVIGGRQVGPFKSVIPEGVPRVDLSRLPPGLRLAAARPRLAYRDVSGAENRTTLIAAIVPGGVITTHTLFCLKTRLANADQLFVCALCNSFVLNFLVRQRVSTHVTTGIVESLPAPRPARTSEAYGAIVSLAASLTGARAGDFDLTAQLQARVAALYGLDGSGFEHILSSFPLVPAREREATLAAFVHPSGI
jgi:hypothetical protein